MNALVLHNPFVQRLAVASTPSETKEIEILSAAARAYAKEREDYEGYVKATYAYILARRKTTELLLPHIQHFHGNQYVGGNTDVTSLSDMGFTRMQWSRRVRELEVGMEELDSYFDECIQNGWHPSLAGLVRSARREAEAAVEKPKCPCCGASLRSS